MLNIQLIFLDLPKTQPEKHNKEQLQVVEDYEKYLVRRQLPILKFI